MLVTSFTQMAIYLTNSTNGCASSNYTKICSDNIPSLAYGEAKADIGKWVHFKLEYTKIEVDGVVKGRTTITIGDTTAVMVKDDTINLGEVDRILFGVQGATIHDTIYDNIVCKMICGSAE